MTPGRAGAALCRRVGQPRRARLRIVALPSGPPAMALSTPRCRATPRRVGSATSSRAEDRRRLPPPRRRPRQSNPRPSPRGPRCPRPAQRARKANTFLTSRASAVTARGSTLNAGEHRHRARVQHQRPRPLPAPAVGVSLASWRAAGPGVQPSRLRVPCRCAARNRPPHHRWRSVSKGAAASRLGFVPIVQAGILLRWLTSAPGWWDAHVRRGEGDPRRSQADSAVESKATLSSTAAVGCRRAAARVLPAQPGVPDEGGGVTVAPKVSAGRAAGPTAETLARPRGRGAGRALPLGQRSEGDVASSRGSTDSSPSFRARPRGVADGRRCRRCALERAPPPQLETSTGCSAGAGGRPGGGRS